MMLACMCGGILEISLVAIILTATGLSSWATSLYNKRQRCKCEKCNGLSSNGRKQL